jgi:protoporphyrinogen oxidase
MSVTILGGGLSGLSTAYHLKRDYVIYEKNTYPGGHIYSDYIDGFTWDEGPHVSFTNNDYVKELFEFNTDHEYLEYPVKTTNYFKGSWIPHPAQTNLYAVPQPLRDACLADFIGANHNFNEEFQPKNYDEWLNMSLGKTFANTFSEAYTRKYWTTNPSDLTTNWVGERVFLPNIDQVRQGYLGPLPEETHYIKNVRYPKKGGYISFAKKMISAANILLSHELESIDFDHRRIVFTNGSAITYQTLISSLPLPVLVQRSNAPSEIKIAAEKLSCSSVLLVNVVANHLTQRPENWIYVYDEDKYSTRINCTELLSPNNAPDGKTGIQVEVYFSKYRPMVADLSTIVSSVCAELIEMGLVKSDESIESTHTKWIQWANVIFDQQREDAQNQIFTWLEQYGLNREADDLSPMTHWPTKFNEKADLGAIILAGRFGQWKYYWTDDCVLRGKWIQENMGQ